MKYEKDHDKSLCSIKYNDEIMRILSRYGTEHLQLPHHRGRAASCCRRFRKPETSGTGSR